MSGIFPDDVPASSLVYGYFDSFAASTGAPTSITGLAVGDIKIYKDGSTTERASTNGYTLLDTDGIDFDAIVGINGFSIDLSDNTTAGFYAANHHYAVVVSTITVDGQTVSFIAGTFWIEQTGGALANSKDIQARIPAALTGAGNIKADALAISGDATAADNCESFFDGTGYAGTNNVIPVVTLVGTLTTYTGNTVQTGDAFGRLGAPVGASISIDIAAIKALLPTALVGGRMDASVGAMAANVMTAAAAAADLTTEITAGLATAANQTTINNNVLALDTKLGTPAGASVSVDIAAVKTATTGIQADTDDIQTRIPAALTGAGNMKTDMLAVNGNALAAARIDRAGGSEVLGTCAALGTTTLVIASAVSPASAVDTQWNGRVMIFAADTTTAALRGQAAAITGYIHATKTFTVATLTTAPALGDTFTVI